jgi:integrase
MPRPRPPRLQRRVSRHGKITWYVRVGRGPLIRIKADHGTPEFDEAYRAALAGRPPAPTVGPSQGTVGWLINLYRASGEWTGLEKTTKERRLPFLTAVEGSAGHKPLSTVTPDTITKGRDARTAPSQARTFIQTMRAMYKWAMKGKFVTVNPTTGVALSNPALSKKKSKGHIPWSEEDLLAYERRWPVGTRERVWLDVYAYTGLRRSDACTVGWQHVKDDVITHINKKTDMRVILPILPVLRRTLDAGPTGDLAFNVNRFRKPFTARGLGKVFSKAARAAGLMNRTAHGLRKAAAMRAAVDGATIPQLNAIFGWTGTLSTGSMVKLGRPAQNKKSTSMLPPQEKVVAIKRKRQ